MTRQALILITIAAIALIPSAVEAKWRFQAGGNLMLEFPQEEFKEKVENTGIGFGGYGAVGIPDWPILFGGSLGGVVYGSEKRKERLISTVPVWVDVETSNKLVLGHLFVRLQPQSGKFLPYVDGLFGFANFWTTTSIKDEGDVSGDPIAVSTNFDEYTSSYGIGGGIMYKVYSRGPGESQGKAFDLAIDVGARYLAGGETEYLKEGSIQIIEGQGEPQIVITPEKSDTDMVSVNIGVSVFF
jgi:hypothetical protein